MTTQQPSRGPADARLNAVEMKWASLEAALDPVRSLVIGVVFSSYLVNHVYVDGNAGQQAWGIGLAVAAALSAVLAPIVGRVADGASQLRPLIAIVALSLVALCASLWFVVPGVSVWLGLVAVLATAVIGDLYGVLINSQLARVVRSASLRLSAIGYTVSQAGTLLAFGAISIVSLPWFLNKLGWGTAFETDRVSGPMAALFCLLFSLPFLLGKGSIGIVPKQEEPSFKLKLSGPVAWIMTSRLLSSTGMFIILGYFGVLPGALFGWTGAQMASYGLAATFVSGIGGLATIVFNRTSDKRIVLLGLVLFGLGATAMLSVSATQIGFGLITPTHPYLPQLVFLSGAMMVALSIAPVEAGQRAMVLKVVPISHAGTAFGYYATATKLVSAAGPFLVGLSLSETNNLSTSLLISLALIAIAILAMYRVRT